MLTLQTPNIHTYPPLWVIETTDQIAGVKLQDSIRENKNNQFDF